MVNQELKAFRDVLLIFLAGSIIWIPVLGGDFFNLKVFNVPMSAGALLIGLGGLFLARDFRNFQQGPKFRHYLMAGVAAPLWPVARWFVLPHVK